MSSDTLTKCRNPTGMQRLDGFLAGKKWAKYSHFHSEHSGFFFFNFLFNLFLLPVNQIRLRIHVKHQVFVYRSNIWLTYQLRCEEK